MPFQNVMRFLAMAIALCAPAAAQAQYAQSGQSPHPAIVRIIAPEQNGISYGSGALIAVSDTYGLVITNWHVVRDATGTIWVAFPNGFSSAATVLKTDRDWDLAALAIWRPNVTPLPVATQAPQPGERLTIAGYGNGYFRAVSGQCVQYVSPGSNQPFEMIELSAPARNGDSGGPILNDRGEIAGVLFGSAFGQTTGSYCGRLRWFLGPVAQDFQRLPAPAQTPVIAGRQSSPLVPVAAIGVQNTPSANAAEYETRTGAPQTASSAFANTQAKTTTQRTIGPGTTITSGPKELLPEKTSWFDQVRNFLAVIGLLAVLIQSLRMVGKLSD